MQITFRATTAAVGTEDTAITTGTVHVLPIWAPPIEYIADNTTGPYLALLTKQTTGTNLVRMRSVRVLAYGRRPTLYSGRECITLDRAVTTTTAALRRYITLSYRAVGEISRP
uniref:Uncharacterized protein n=1 Tax=viral metagenome TaxID=1070528 RepID=A0A6M3JWE7_9ZZZZ